MTELAASLLTDDADADEIQPTDVPADVPSVVAPDRADAPVSEVTERFLRAIVARVPLERIEELHLFAPLRQGGTETGIAVIAARVPVLPVEAAAGSPPDGTVELAGELAPELALDVDAEDVSVDAEDVPVDVGATDDETDDAIDDSPYLNQDVAFGETLEVLPAEASDDEPVADVIADRVSTPIVRHTVYTARYRLVLKGSERGKWEADVVDEADAPLITVEMVVRGVQRRAGEETEILRYSERQIARALRLEWPLPVAVTPVVPLLQTDVAEASAEVPAA